METPRPGEVLQRKTGNHAQHQNSCRQQPDHTPLDTLTPTELPQPHPEKGVAAQAKQQTAMCPQPYGQDSVLAAPGND